VYAYHVSFPLDNRIKRNENSKKIMFKGVQRKKNSPPNTSNPGHPDRHARSDHNCAYNDGNIHRVDHYILRTEGDEERHDEAS